MTPSVFAASGEHATKVRARVSSSLKKTEAGTRPERLFSTNMASQVRGLDLKKTEAGTRPEGLPSSNMWSQVRRVDLKKPESRTRCVVPTSKRRRRRQGRSAYPHPIPGPRCVVPGARSQPEKRRRRGQDRRAGGLILKQYGFQARGLNLKTTESGDKAGTLILHQGIGSQVRGWPVHLASPVDARGFAWERDCGGTQLVSLQF